MKLALGTLSLALAVSAAIAAQAQAQAQTVTQDIKVPGGRVRVAISPLPASGAEAGPRVMPRVGVAATGLLANAVARNLDESGKARVMSPARFSTRDAGSSFDTMTKSEFGEALAAACTRTRVDYALYSGSPQSSGGVSTSAFIFGFGRMKQTQTFEMRLYNCRSKQPAWVQSVAVEDSSGLWSNFVAGKVSAGGSQSQDAAALMIVNKLIADLGFSAGGTAQGAPPPAAQTRAPREIHKAEAVVMAKPGQIYAAASTKSRVMRVVASGTILYPTGTAQGLWTQVTDEEGASGWVSTRLVEEYQP